MLGFADVFYGSAWDEALYPTYSKACLAGVESAEGKVSTFSAPLL
jgi:hypothetical protein